MINIEEIKEEVRRYILAEFLPGEKPSNLRDDMPLRGIVDSMGTLLLVRLIEQKLGFEIEPQELRANDFASIDNIAAFVTRRTAILS